VVSSTYETNKAAWRRLGDRQYVRIEVRPPRKQALADNGVSIDLDFLPSHDSGAYEAISALTLAATSQRGLRILNDSTEESRSEQFYAALKEFAEKWTP